MRIVANWIIPVGASLNSSAAFARVNALAILGDGEIGKRELVGLGAVSERCIGVNSES